MAVTTPPRRGSERPLHQALHVVELRAAEGTAVGRLEAGGLRDGPCLQLVHGNASLTVRTVHPRHVHAIPTQYLKSRAFPAEPC